jgi:hypothetical protein
VLHKDKEISEVFRLELQKHDAKRKLISQVSVLYSFFFFVVECSKTI